MSGGGGGGWPPPSQQAGGGGIGLHTCSHFISSDGRWMVASGAGTGEGAEDAAGAMPRRAGTPAIGRRALLLACPRQGAGCLSAAPREAIGAVSTGWGRGSALSVRGVATMLGCD